MRLPIALIDYAAPRLIAYSQNKPYFDLEGYMERHWVFEYAPYTLGYSARIHKILRSDSDRAYHDHPWPYITVILDGGYFETTPVYNKGGIFQGERTEFYGKGSVLVRPANHMHRLALPDGKPATTLFICGRWKQDWGFIPNPRWKIYWRDYLKDEASAEPRPDMPGKMVGEKSERFLCCSCTRCKGMTYMRRYNTQEDIASAAEEFLELLKDDRRPFVLDLVCDGDEAIPRLPKFCDCLRKGLD